MPTGPWPETCIAVKVPQEEETHTVPHRNCRAETKGTSHQMQKRTRQRKHPYVSAKSHKQASSTQSTTSPNIERNNMRDNNEEAIKNTLNRHDTNHKRSPNGSRVWVAIHPGPLSVNEVGDEPNP